MLHDPPGHREAVGDQQSRHSEAQLQRWHLSHQQVLVTVCLVHFLAQNPYIFFFRKYFSLMGVFFLILVVLIRIRTGSGFNSVSGPGSGSILSESGSDPDWESRTAASTATMA